MPPKQKADGKGGKAKPNLGVELGVEQDLKRLVDAMGKLKCSLDAVTPFQKKVKLDLQKFKDADPPENIFIPYVVFDPLPYDTCRGMLNALLTYPWLKQISLLHCGIGDDGVMVLCDFVKQYAPHAERNPFGIELLELPGNDITHKGASYLAKLMTQNESVKTLVLDFNPLEDQGAQELGDGLKWNSTLDKLSMQYCGIGEVGGEAIAKLIVRSSSVKDLSLRGNPLQPRGVSCISRSLAKNAYLTTLDLADTSFGIDLDTIEALRDGIEGNDTLTDIDLDFNSLVPAGANLLQEMLTAKKKVLRFVVFERMDATIFNQIGDQIMLNIKNAKKGGKKAKPKKGDAAAPGSAPGTAPTAPGSGRGDAPTSPS